MKYLLDSVILIDHFNGYDQATEFISDNYSELAISVITRAEILTGFDRDSSPMIEGLLDRFPNLPIDEEAANLAAELRRQRRWKLPDALQAALAQIYRLKLVTRNTKDFKPNRDLFVIIPYRT